MIEGTDQNIDKIEKVFCSYLDNGWCWRAIHQDIVASYNTKQPFPHYKYAKPYNGCDRNLLKQGRFYYHKAFKIISKLNAVHLDIDKGTFTRQQNVYWCEQKASFNIDDLVQFFYDKLGQACNNTEYPINRLKGILKSLLQEMDIEEIMFMVEAAARHTLDGKKFDFRSFRDYHTQALGYLEEIKNNCKYSGGDHYVKRERKLSG